MTEEIIWKDPPNNRNVGVWIRRLTPLLDHPNRWALVATTKGSSTATLLRKGYFKIPEGNWEFRHHAVEGGKAEIYARYLGPTEEES